MNHPINAELAPAVDGPYAGLHHAEFFDGRLHFVFNMTGNEQCISGLRFGLELPNFAVGIIVLDSSLQVRRGGARFLPHSPVPGEFVGVCTVSASTSKNNVFQLMVELASDGDVLARLLIELKLPALTGEAMSISGSLIGDCDDVEHAFRLLFGATPAEQRAEAARLARLTRKIAATQFALVILACLGWGVVLALFLCK